LVISFATRFWADQKAASYTGPTHIAADGKQVYLFASDELYHLSAGGRLLEQLPISVAGLEDVPIDLRITEDGDLLIASQRPADIQICNPKTWACRALEFPSNHRPQRQFKVLWPGGQYRLIFTDALGDGLWGQALESTFLQQLLPQGALAGPNDLAFDDQDHLWVADTDHRRIVELVHLANDQWEVARVHSAMNDLTRKKRHYPMMLVFGSDGNMWVTQTAEWSEGSGDLVIYHPDQGAIEQVSLPGSIFATDIATSGDDLLVTDLETHTVYRVDTKTHETTVFGDEQFIQAMGGLKQRAQYFTRMSTMAMAGVVVFAVLMLIAAIKATPRDKRWTPLPGRLDLSSNQGPLPPVKGVYWLKREKKIQRFLNFTHKMGYLGVIVVFLGLALMFIWVQTQTAAISDEQLASFSSILIVVALMVSVMAGLAIPLLIHGSAALKNRLGTDGKHILIRLHDGRELRVEPEELFYTDRAILYRKYTLTLQSGKLQKLYQEGELETWIAPLMADGRKLNEWEGLKHQWKYRNPLLLWLLVFIAISLALAVVFSFLSK